jgi:hypothetical protein
VQAQGVQPGCRVALRATLLRCWQRGRPTCSCSHGSPSGKVSSERQAEAGMQCAAESSLLRVLGMASDKEGCQCSTTKAATGISNMGSNRSCHVKVLEDTDFEHFYKATTATAHAAYACCIGCPITLTTVKPGRSCTVAANQVFLLICFTSNCCLLLHTPS